MSNNAPGKDLLCEVVDAGIRRSTPAGEALEAKAIAQAKRGIARRVAADDPEAAAELTRDAEGVEATAAAILTLDRQPEVGTGGELVPPEVEGPEGSQMVDTVKDPDAVTLHASKRRLELASEARCLTLAADMAETIQAANSVEKALAQGMAGCHALGMRFMERAHTELDLAAREERVGVRQSCYVEANRCARTASRLLEAFGKAATTLQRLRSGGEQKVTVVHQHVDARGGNVAVAGAVSGTGGQGGEDGKS